MFDARSFENGIFVCLQFANLALKASSEITFFIIIVMETAIYVVYL